MGLSFPFEPAHLLNTERYPIQDISSTKTQNTIRQLRSQLREDGCAVIANFLSADGLSQLLAEAQERRPLAYFSTQKKTNVYFSEDDPALPLSHPRRIFLNRTNGFVPSDCYDKATASRTLFQWPALKRFIQECLSKTSLHQYADPVAAMPINVLTPVGSSTGTLTPTSSPSPCCSRALSKAGILSMRPISEMNPTSAMTMLQPCWPVIHPT